MSEVTFCVKPLAYLKDVLAPKFEHAHWEEVGRDKRYKPDLHWAYYEALDKAGMVHILVLLLDGEPEGYFVGLLSEHLHYKTMRVFTSDMFYVSERCRALHGVKLFREAESLARKLGAHKMNVTYKTYKNIEPIMRRLRFKPLEVIAVKNLDED